MPLPLPCSRTRLFAKYEGTFFLRMSTRVTGLVELTFLGQANKGT